MKKTNKVNRPVGKIFNGIFSFFDKWLITPITKGILKITDFIKDNSRGLEKFVNNKQTLIVLSLIFALAVFFVVDQNSNAILYQSAEVLYNQPVTAEYNEEAYVIEGLPETVDITLIGRSSDIYLAKQYPTHEVSVDLRELKPGSHKVTLKYKQNLASIDYKLDPSTATIVVYEKVSETRELTYDVLHRESLDSKLTVSNVTLDRNDVIIKGAEYKLKQVATVKALVDIDNISNPEVGDITLKDVPLVAYDSSGNIVDVEIVPSTVTATVSIASPSKELPVEIVPTGELAFGKAIKSLTSNVSSIIVYGDQEVLDQMTSFPVEISIDNLDKDKDYNINIQKPSGIREVSVKTLVVHLTLDDVITREFENLGVEWRNLDDTKYTVQAYSEADRYVTAIVRGSQEVIDNLDPSTIKVTIDLANLGPGTHEVDVVVTGSDLKLTYEPKVKKIRVTITEK